MLRTNEGKTVLYMLKEFRKMEKQDPMTADMTFEISGKTSKSYGFEDLTVTVKCDMIWIRIIGKDEIKIPNYGQVETLSCYVEDGIELMFFKSNVTGI